MDNKRPETLEEAIRAINEAMIAEGAKMRDLIQSDYASLRTAVEDLAPRVVQQFKDATAPYVEKAKATASKAKTTAREVAGPQIDFAVAGSKSAADKFDQQLKKNPYLVLGGVALGAIAIGYLLGRTKTPTAADYTGLSYGDAPLGSKSDDNVELG